MDLLKFAMELVIWYYLIVIVAMKVVKGLNILQVEKEESHVVLTISLQESELIYMIPYLLKKY